MNRFTKIVATVGHASASRETLARLIQAGVNVFRLNFSHGTQEEHRTVLERIRALEQEMQCCIGVLADLQGPKLRVGQLKGGAVTLKAGDAFDLDTSTQLGDDTRVCFPHPEMYGALTPGSHLLLDDGRLSLEVVSHSANKISTRVLVGGELKDRKGVNVPDVCLPISALTKKDKDDAAFLKTLDIDFLALSFVQKPEDIRELRDLVGPDIQIVAKIEKPQALKHLDAIVSVADGIMIARGDLGVELPLEQVPRAQKHIVEVARKHGKPVIVATQMLESMVHSATPTRAEISDVANAVYEGADAVMLSAETAVGEHPEKVVSVMAKTIVTTESDHQYRSLLSLRRPAPDATTTDAVTIAAGDIADRIGAPVIAVVTATGNSVRRAARQRSWHALVGVTPSSLVAHALTLCWGVVPCLVHDLGALESVMDHVMKFGASLSLLQPNDKIIVTGGQHLGTPGSTNFLYVHEGMREAS